MPQQRSASQASALVPRTEAPARTAQAPVVRPPTPDEFAAMAIEAVRNTTRVHRRMTGKRAKRQQARNTALEPRRR